MKKSLISSTFIISLFLLFSCNQDDDSSLNNSNFEELIVGQWKRNAFTIDGEASQSNCATDFKITFGVEGNYGESPFDGTTCTSTGNTGTYSISGSELSISSAFFSETYEITTLDDSTFIYSYNNQSDELVEHTYSKL